MTRTPHATTRRPSAAFLRNLTVIALITLLAMHVSSTASLAQQAPVGLGTADSFAVLAGTPNITNTGSTTITGDVGIHPGTAYEGSDSVTLNGEEHIGDAVALQAKNDLVTAYDVAAGRDPNPVGVELGGEELTGGVYSSGTFEITGTLTLDAEGDPSTVWVFQAASTLVTMSDSVVSLINGADACNVYWQVGSSATLGTGSSFAGTIMALTSITLDNGATVQGRALARNGAVTMDTNTITNAACTTPVADDDAPVDDAPADDAPADDAPVDDAPVDDAPVDEAPVEDDASAEDDTASGEDTPTAGDSPTDGDTTSQIEEVPSGSVAAGGGGGGVGAATSGLWVLFAGVLMFLVVGGTVGVIGRRRVRP